MPAAEPALRRLLGRLDELGVDPALYRVDGLAEGAWCLLSEGSGWSVFRYERGVRHEGLAFEAADQAAAYLLGTLLLNPSPAAQESGAAGRPSSPQPAPAPPPGTPGAFGPQSPPDPYAPADPYAPPAPYAPGASQEPGVASYSAGPPAGPGYAAPPPGPESISPPPPPPPPPPPMALPAFVADEGAIEPLADEPPLGLFTHQHLVDVPAGTIVDRYGPPSGNVTYAARTPFPQRSLPADWSGRAYRAFVLQRPVRALTGVAIPWFDQPGGGTAYIFRRSVQELLDDGTLVEVPGRPAP